MPDRERCEREDGEPTTHGKGGPAPRTKPRGRAPASLEPAPGRRAAARRGPRLARAAPASGDQVFPLATVRRSLSGGRDAECSSPGRRKEASMDRSHARVRSGVGIDGRNPRRRGRARGLRARASPTPRRSLAGREGFRGAHGSAPRRARVAEWGKALPARPERARGAPLARAAKNRHGAVRAGAVRPHRGALPAREHAPRSRGRCARWLQTACAPAHGEASRGGRGLRQAARRRATTRSANRSLSEPRLDPSLPSPSVRRAPNPFRALKTTSPCDLRAELLADRGSLSTARGCSTRTGPRRARGLRGTLGSSRDAEKTRLVAARRLPPVFVWLPLEPRCSFRRTCATACSSRSTSGLPIQRIVEGGAAAVGEPAIVIEPPLRGTDGSAFGGQGLYHRRSLYAFAGQLAFCRGAARPLGEIMPDGKVRVTGQASQTDLRTKGYGGRARRRGRGRRRGDRSFPDNPPMDPPVFPEPGGVQPRTLGSRAVDTRSTRTSSAAACRSSPATA